MKEKNVELKIKSFGDIKKIIFSNYPLFFVIAFLIFVTYINGINGEFVSDDIAGISENKIVHDLGASLQAKNIQQIMYSFIYNFIGKTPVPFHAFSMIFHFVDVILFFVLIYNLYDKKIAAYASVLYAVHPVGAETVLWISALNYLINTFVLFTSLLMYLIFRKTGKKLFLVMIVVYFFLVALVFPNFWLLLIPIFLLAIEIFYISPKINKKALLFLTPLFILALIAFAAWGRVTLFDRVGSLKTPDATPFLNRIPFTFAMPWLLFIWPKELTIYHEGQIITTFKYAAMTVATLATIFGPLIMLRKSKLRKYGVVIIMIFLSTLPVFSPIQVAWFTAERYLYISTGFFCVLLTMLMLDIQSKYKIKNFAIILTCLLILAYSARDFARTKDWKTRKLLWESTARIGPYSPRVHNNLGDVYGLEQDWERAIYHFQISIKLKPDFYFAMHNLANTYMKMGDYEKAEPWLIKSLELNPGLYQSIHKLALIEYGRGNIDKAKELLNKTLEYDPSYLPAIEALQILQQRNL